MNRTVTLVDPAGKSLGQADLLEAHTGDGKLHLAFSIFLFNQERDALLLQRRSEKKMLWPMAWANTCCSHPYEKESPLDAGKRRLKEEMGIVTTLKEGPSFTYLANDPNRRGIEHEYDTILVGVIPEDTDVHPDPNEVSEWKWMKIAELREDIAVHADLYAPWLPLGLAKLLD